MGFTWRSVILTPADLSYAGWIPLLVDAGCNSLLLHAAGACDIDRLIAWMHSLAGQEITERCRQAGLLLETQLHTSSWFLPRELFYRQPEYFRMNTAGERSPDANFCFMNDAAWVIAAGRVIELQRLLPAETGRYLWFTDDVASAPCLCPKCVEFSPSDQALYYANRLACLLRSHIPGAMVSYLAYQDTLECPTLIQPEAGVFCEFAPIWRCYEHAIDDPDCAENHTHLEKLARLLEWFQPAPLHITKYWLDASRFSGWKRPASRLPVPTDMMRRDIAAYRRMGAASIASYAVMCDADYWEAHGEPPVMAFGDALIRG